MVQGRLTLSHCSLEALQQNPRLFPCGCLAGGVAELDHVCYPRLQDTASEGAFRYSQE